MKTIKTLITLLLVTNAFAIDRIVQENGPVGTFATISAAIIAAADGDRIIVYPKIGDNPYVENITIDKTLELASAQDGVRYKIQGNIIITALNNRTVSIVGAQLVSGNISGSSLSGWRTTVNIMGCILEAGNITFNEQYYTGIVSNILATGNISISHGKIIGNDLQNRIISISNSTSITDDTMNIIANKVSAINCSSNINLNIYNNFISRINNINNPNFNSISYTYSSISNSKLNIINNTILTGPLNSNSYTQTNRPYFFRLASPAVIKNNIFQSSVLAVQHYLPIFENVINTSAFNNYIFYGNGGAAVPSPNYYTLSSQPVNEITGLLLLPSLAQNGAEPSFEYYDLDLTVGDAGCYGGSYTLDNYFPITGSSRVYNIDMPFGITTSGAPLNIKADGFDR